MAEADITNNPHNMTQVQHDDSSPLVDPKILTDKYVTLVRDLDVEIVLESLKPVLQDPHVHAINAETNCQDKTRKLCDILKRISCTEYGVFNSFLRIVGGIQPDLFLELVGRAPSANEADYCVENYVKDLKNCIRTQRHSTDSLLDEEINFDCEHVPLSIKSDNRSSGVSQDLPHRHQSHLSDAQHKEVSAMQILDSAPDEKPPKQVSVYGRAGTGKTTTFQWLAREWSLNRWATQFTLLFLLKLRMLSASDLKMTALELLTLAGLYHVPGHVKPLASWLKHAAGRLVIFIDGLDEVAGFITRLKNCPKIYDLNQNAHPIDLCLNILSGNLLPGCTVVTASKHFTGLTAVKFDKRFEILGLTESKIKKFVHCKHAAKAVDIMGVLNNNPLLMSVCAITFYCTLITRLLADGVVFTNEDLKTYSRLMAFLIVQCVERRFPDWSFVIQVSSYFQKLAKMAYIGVFERQIKGKMPKLVFKDYDLSKAQLSPLELRSIQDIGILQMKKVKVGLRHSVDAEFLHFSIQEMLASAYLLSDVPSTNVLKQVFSEGQFTMALLYLVGLQYDTDSDWIRDIKQSVNPSGRGHGLVEVQMNNIIQDLCDGCLSGSTSRLQLCQLVYEGQMEDKAEYVIECIAPNGKLTMKDTSMTLIDLMAISFVCKHADNITEISLTNCGLTDRLLGSLTSSLLNESERDLLVLKLRANELQEAKALADWVKPNHNLHTLDLIGNNINENGAIALASALETNCTLQILDVGRNMIGENGTKALAKALPKSSLQTLSVGYNSIGEKGAREIAVALKENQKLQTLFVNNNKIGDSGIVAVAEALHHNSTLHTLYVNTNDIGERGAEALAAALHTNNTLQTLIVWGNRIGDAGAVTLATALEANSTLQTLDVGSNGIRDEGAAALGNSLLNNSSLHTLYAVHNHIGDNGAISLAAGLKANNGVHLLDVRYNGIGARGLASFEGVKRVAIKSDSQQ